MDPTNETAGKEEVISAGQDAMIERMVRGARASKQTKISDLLLDVVIVVDGRMKRRAGGSISSMAKKAYAPIWGKIRERLLNHVRREQARATQEIINALMSDQRISKYKKAQLEEMSAALAMASASRTVH